VSGKDDDLILGLNPGKNGCNKTSVAFTDPYIARNDLKMDIPYDPQRENSSKKLFPLFLEVFNNVISKFFEHIVLTNILPLGAVKPGKAELINVNFNELTKLLFFSELCNFHINRLINIFEPRYISAVGEDGYKFIRNFLRNNYPEIILIQAAHPASEIYFTNVEKQRWIKMLQLDI
jgi:hypothetical protein